jgi:hypothetical protein
MEIGIASLLKWGAFLHQNLMEKQEPETVQLFKLILPTGKLPGTCQYRTAYLKICTA